MKDRIFTTKDPEGEDLVLLFKRPTQKTISKSELVYREKYSEAFRKGLLLNAEVIEVMKKRGLWDKSKEDEAQVMMDNITALEDKLKDPELNNVDGRRLCEEITQARADLMTHNRMMTSVTDNTVESCANEERNQFLTAECVYNNKTGVKVYKDTEDFRSRLDEPASIDSYRETVIASLEAMTGRDLSSDLTEEYAENKWLKERGLLKDEAEDESEVKVS
ncbi:MAG: hypothetical protein ACXABY_02165 [Candidatus Thorarchaeota archaeon]|jgi:hypothetical protein